VREITQTTAQAVHIIIDCAVIFLENIQISIFQLGEMEVKKIFQII
jgi:hypothetical protein